MTTLRTLTLVLLLAALPAAALDRDAADKTIIDDGSMVLDAGNLLLNVTNLGLLGATPGVTTAPWHGAPSARWPGAGGVDHLYAAGLWVGARVLGSVHVTTGQFEREMQAIGKLVHPNIVLAHDAGEHQGKHFLVMEFVEGIDLSAVVQHFGPLPIGAACEIIRQAAIGLQYVHECGQVHRDIKPSNLMLSSAGTVKILDLGLALLLEQYRDDSDLTGLGQPM